MNFGQLGLPSETVSFFKKSIYESFKTSEVAFGVGKSLLLNATQRLKLSSDRISVFIRGDTRELAGSLHRVRLNTTVAPVWEPGGEPSPRNWTG